MKKTVVLVLTMLAVSVMVAVADENHAASTMQMPKAGAEMTAIAPIFGIPTATWNGKCEAGVLGPDSKEMPSHGKVTCRSLTGGLWYACDLEDIYGEGKEAMMTWKGHLVVGYDLNAKAYKGVLVDNTGAITPFDGRLDGTSFVLETPTEISIMGQMVKDRLTWNFTDPKSIKFTDEHQPTGGDWKLAESGTMKPSPKTAAKSALANDPNAK